MDNGASSYLRFLNGDNEAFVEIIRQYKDGLVLFINSFVSNIHLSEEAADEAFLKLYVNKPRYRSGNSFKTWLYTIGRNTALNYLKKSKRISSEPIDDYYYISDETDIEAEYIKGEQNIILHQAIGALKKEYAQVLYLIYFEELTNAETAHIMGKTQRQLSDLIYRAKNSLRSELERRGYNGQI
ncbi:MAG: sigma-70 family RNA polymerase sigma factor [Ruminococcus sp.]|nr:sigma-70 family RNA polymerase sigma factor [Ruminococcus sp.]